MALVQNQDSLLIDNWHSLLGKRRVLQGSAQPLARSLFGKLNLGPSHAHYIEQASVSC